MNFSATNRKNCKEKLAIFNDITHKIINLKSPENGGKSCWYCWIVRMLWRELEVVVVLVVVVVTQGTLFPVTSLTWCVSLRKFDVIALDVSTLVVRANSFPLPPINWCSLFRALVVAAVDVKVVVTLGNRLSLPTLK